MDVNLEDAHKLIDEVGELIEKGNFKEARAAVRKFIGVLDNIDYHLKTIKKP